MDNKCNTAEKTISIVIPTYEVNGKAKELLEDLLNSIHLQTYKNIEVVISDHSKDDVIKEYIKLWDKKLNIIYLKNERGVGNSSINMNEGIKVASGDYIKIMHMDDFFFSNEALSKMSELILLDESVKWGAFGFNHNYVKEGSIRRDVIPEYYQISESASALMGCPSVSFFINDKTNFFDENMIIANDFDMHYTLEKKYGKPFILSDISITIRVHDDQVTHTLDSYSEKESAEIEYFKNKNNIK